MRLAFSMRSRRDMDENTETEMAHPPTLPRPTRHDVPADHVVGVNSMVKGISE